MNRQTMTLKNPLMRGAMIVAAALMISGCDGSLPVPTATETPPLEGAAIGGPFTLTAANGDKVNWDDFKGKYRIVYFGYAFCPDVCPTDMQRSMAGLKLFEKDKPEQGANIQPIFITIDPARDTQQVVGEFAANFHPRLIGLTGTEAEIKAAADVFRVYYSRGENSAGGGYLMVHSNITYLFGPNGEPLATLPTDQGPEEVAAELAKWVH